jgi:uncharacterized membrane protein (DUF2068 family)
MPSSRPARAEGQSAAPGKRAAGLYTIIAIKLGKALLLLAVALGLFSLMDDDLQAQFDRFLRWVNVNPEREVLRALGRRLQHLTPANLGWLASGSLVYGVLLLGESGGLMFRAYWAVWLAVGETAFFIPIEILELLRHPSLFLAAVLAVNLFIVVYLVRNRDRLFHHHQRRR